MSRLTQQVMHAYYQRDADELQRLADGETIRAQSTQRRINTLADALSDQVRVPHRWLREAIEAHFSGKPVPPLVNESERA